MKKLTVLLPAAAVLIIAGLTVHGLSLRRQLSPPKTIERFHRLYYATRPYATTSFLGVPSMQYPSDNWVTQEIISEVKPDYIIETGTAAGGTALFYALVLENVNDQGKVITIDITSDALDPRVAEFRIWRERVEFVRSSSVSEELVRGLADRVRGRKVLVQLDSAHHRAHVLQELRMYSPLVSRGSYIIVSDTHLGGHPNDHPTAEKGRGPWEAVETFLKENRRFRIDHSREKHLITQQPSGFLKRIR